MLCIATYTHAWIRATTSVATRLDHPDYSSFEWVKSRLIYESGSDSEITINITCIERSILSNRAVTL